MTEDKGILIKNIYHMLTYAFRVLNQTTYEQIAAESFDRIENLFAAILARGISQQLKQGLYREYVTRTQILPTLRGKLDISGTITQKMQRRQRLSCEFDELSENNIYNQILKATAGILIRSKEVDTLHRKSLKRLMLFFGNVDTIQPSAIRWQNLKYNRSNRTYQMLINVCYFVLDGLLQTTEDGKYLMAAFSEEHMARLYERFILEYYRHEHKNLTARAEQIEWNLDADNDEYAIRFLPAMKTDITLRSGTKTLIIDAKYYSHTMQTHFDHTSVHSGNLYQIFAYVKNMEAAACGNVGGMLLYAKTGESITPDFTFSIGGSRISVKTLDLNSDFSQIRNQLDKIANEYFQTN